MKSPVQSSPHVADYCKSLLMLVVLSNVTALEKVIVVEMITITIQITKKEGVLNSSHCRRNDYYSKHPPSW